MDYISKSDKRGLFKLQSWCGQGKLSERPWNMKTLPSLALESFKIAMFTNAWLASYTRNGRGAGKRALCISEPGSITVQNVYKRSFKILIFIRNRTGFHAEHGVVNKLNVIRSLVLLLYQQKLLELKKFWRSINQVNIYAEYSCWIIRLTLYRVVWHPFVYQAWLPGTNGFFDDTFLSLHTLLS